MARDAGIASASVSSALARWVASVRARAPRESAPSPELWNAPKLDPAASLARELHRAGNRVRKWTIHAPDATSTATYRGDTSEEVVFHVVARSVPAALLRGVRGADESDPPDTDEKTRSEDFQALRKFVESFEPFFSTRKNAGAHGKDIPARAFLGDAKAVSSLEDDIDDDDDDDVNDEAVEAAGAKRLSGETKTRISKKKSEEKTPVLPGDVCARGLLLALAECSVGERAFIEISPEYAHLDPDHGSALIPRSLAEPGSRLGRKKVFPPPPRPPRSPEDVLFFDATVLRRYEASVVRKPPASPSAAVSSREGRSRRSRPEKKTSGAFGAPYAWKRVAREGAGWERPRPPFEARAEVTASRASTFTGDAGETETAGEAFFPKTVIAFTCGDGSVPPELDAAVRTMRVGEEAVAYVPPRRTAVRDGDGDRDADRDEKTKRYRLLFGTPDISLDGFEYRIGLLGMTHVRDVFGDGAVVKRRVREGPGEFPADCPVRDCEVRVRWSARVFAADEEDAAGMGTARTHADAEDAEETDSDVLFSRFARLPGFVHDTGTPSPSGAFKLGAGAAPEAVETSVRLMIPGETSRVLFSDCALETRARYGFEATPEAPGAKAALEAISRVTNRSTEAGSPPARACLEFLIRLVDFEKPVNWYRADFSEMLGEAEGNRAEGNALFRKGRLELAKTKYEKTLRDLKGIRGIDSDADRDKLNDLVVALALNAAMTHQKLGDHASALRRAREVLVAEPQNAKALWRRGVSLAATHEYDAARADFTRVLALDGSLADDVARELAKIDRTERRNFKKEKKFIEASFEAAPKP